jgi:hypothetical protein
MKLDWSLLIPIIVPALIALVKLVAPKIPKPLLPVIAPILGVGLEMVREGIMGTQGVGAVEAAGLGLAGVGVREVVDQAKGKMGQAAAVLLLVCSLAAGPLLMGCKSVDQATTVTRVASIAELAAYTGASVYMLDHPESGPAFSAGLIALNLLIADERWDLNGFRAALEKLPTKELKGERGSILIGTAVLLFDQLAREYVDLDRTAWLKPVMIAVRDGLRRAVEAYAILYSPSSILSPPATAYARAWPVDWHYAQMGQRIAVCP